MKTILLALCVVFLSASTAEACRSCGIFGLRCRAVQQKQVVVKKQSYGYAYQQPSNTTNLSLINVYPASTAQYGVAHLAQAYQPNPSLSLELSAKIANQALDNQAASIRLAQEHSQASVELQRLALATEHLRAAMGTGTQQQSSSSLSVEVRQGAGSTSVSRDESREDYAASPSALLAQKCSQCHGLDLQQPKGQLYFDSDHQLTASDSVAASRVVAGIDVPEEMREVIQSLTDQERCQLLIEIATLARR